MEHIYEVNVDWEQDRKGLMSSPVLNHSVQVATPPQFPKGMEGIWSPEHLFVAAINTCLMTTFLAIAENSKLDFVNFSSKGSGKLEMVEGKYIMSEVTLEPVVSIEHSKDKERAERVLQKSELNCLISNSVKSKIVFKPHVKVLTPAL